MHTMRSELIDSGCPPFVLTHQTHSIEKSFGKDKDRIKSNLT